MHEFFLVGWFSFVHLPSALHMVQLIIQMLGSPAEEDIFFPENENRVCRRLSHNFAEGSWKVGCLVCLRDFPNGFRFLKNE